MYINNLFFIIRLLIYIILATCYLVHSTSAWAQGFNPDNPAEPSAKYRLTVVADPAEGGTVTGGGMFAVNTNRTVKATVNGVAWRFVNWTNSADEVVSTNASFTYRTTNNNETLTAHFAPVATSTITLRAEPANAGTNFSLSGAGTYAQGANASISATNYTNWDFQGWTLNDVQVSANRSFQYVVPDHDVELVAHYKYNPTTNPSEPNETKASHKVYFVSNPADAGTFDKTSGFSVREGQNFSVTTSNKSNWRFVNWTKFGTDIQVGASKTYSSTMGTEDVSIQANFVYDPGNPSDPGSDPRQHFTLYGQTVQVFKGQKVLYPVYLENTAEAKEISFDIELPNGVEIDKEGLQTTSRTSAYTATASGTEPTISVSLTGGSLISDNNGSIVMIPVTVVGNIDDGAYSIGFSNITLTLSNDSQPTVTSRQGTLDVATLEEGDLQAQFSVDKYMNRVQFTNMSSEGCISFHWDFGDGEESTERSPMHIYAQPGNYTVTLQSSGYVKQSEAEQQIVINSPGTWTASGDYTVDCTGSGVRNFANLSELLHTLDQCSMVGNINVELTEPDRLNYEYSAMTDDDLAVLTSLTTKATQSGYKISFTSDVVVNINLTTQSASENMQQATAFIISLGQVTNVNIKLNGYELNLSALRFAAEQSVCAEANTQAVNLADICSSGDYSAEWVALINEGNTLDDYEIGGTGSIPQMAITNPAGYEQNIRYQIDLKLGGNTFYSVIHIVRVKPLISLQTINNVSPADNAELGWGNRTISWSNMGSIATGYTIYIMKQLGSTPPEMDWNTAEIVNRPSNANSYVLNCEAGYAYTWQIVAIGECDYLEGPLRTFTVKKKSDLAVTNVSVAPSVKALTKLNVTATITNIGEGETYSSSWYDRIDAVTENVGSHGGTTYKQTLHNGVLAPGESYEVTFEMTAPDAQIPQVSYRITTDYNGVEAESNELNNATVSSTIDVAESYMNENDYANLKALFFATNGEAWTRPWTVNTNAINNAAWRGVTFNEDGRVTAIDISNNNLSGDVPDDFQMPLLTNLNMSHNNITGNLSDFVDELTALKTLNMSYCLFTTLENPLPANITSLNIGYQCNNKPLNYFDRQEWTMATNISNVVLSRLLSYDHKKQNFSAHPTLSLYSVGGSYLGNLSWNGSTYKLTLSGDYKLESGADINVKSTDGNAYNCRLHGSFTWIEGDANANTFVDIADAQHALNRILSRQSGNFNFAAADVYTDNVINVQDVVSIINIFFVEEPIINAKDVNGQQSTVNSNVNANEVYISGEGLYLDARDRVAALDITLSGIMADEMSLALNHSLYNVYVNVNVNGNVRLVIISPTGDVLDEGVSKLLKISNPNAQIVAAKAVDVDAKDVRLEIGVSTGVSHVENVGNVGNVGNIYNLAGQRIGQLDNLQIDNLPKGIYIINGRKEIRK